jgi:hypothetical protein
MASATQRRAVRKKTAKKAAAAAKKKAAAKAKLNTPEAKHARRNDRNPLYNPGVQLAGDKLAQAAGDLTDLEFKPKEQALADQLSTATRQGTALADRASGYYKDLASGEAARMAQQQALRDRLSSSLGAIGDKTQQQIGEAKVGAVLSNQADRDLRGGGLSGGGDEKLTNELAMRQAQASQAAQGYKSDAEAQSGNYAGLQGAMAGTRDLKGGEAQQQLLNRLATEQAGIRSKRTDLESLRGETKTKHILDLRQTGFENAATLEGLGIKREDIAAQTEQAKASASAKKAQLKEVSRSNRAKEKIAAKKLGITVAELHERQRHNKAGEGTAQQNANTAARRAAKASAKKKGKTPDRVLNARSDILTAESVYNSQFRGNFAKYRKALEGKGYKLPIIRAGFERANQGYIGPNTYKLLRQIGVSVPPEWLRRPSRPRARPRSGGPVSNTASGVLGNVGFGAGGL